MNTPNQTQKDWMNRVSRYAREHGSFPFGNAWAFQIHHVEGRSKVINEKGFNHVAIGHWFILPIDFCCHSPFGVCELHVHNSRRQFTKAFGTQLSLFLKMIEVIKKEDDGQLPFDDEVLDAIKCSQK